MEGPLDRVDPHLRKIFEKHPGAHKPVTERAPGEGYLPAGEGLGDEEVLARVLEIAGDIESRVPDAMRQVVTQRAFPDNARRSHLWAVTPSAAIERIRTARAKASRKTA